MSLLAAALLLAAPAAAEVLIFDAGRDPRAGIIWSADAYHYAYLEGDEREQRWIVDGKPRYVAPAGTFAGPATLSANGSTLLHGVVARDKTGAEGIAAAINGRKAGAPFPEMEGPLLSARGSNAAYIIKTPSGWAVVSQQGVGPAFVELPLYVGVTETETLYFVPFGGATWLYRNHKPVKKTPYGLATANRDLTTTAGVWRSEREDLIYVEVGADRFGPYAEASLPAFSSNGRHWAFLATNPKSHGRSYDILIVDGAPAPMRSCSGCTLRVGNDGRAYQDVILTAVDDRAQLHAQYLHGKSVHPGSTPPTVCLSPGGKHYAYPTLAPQGSMVGIDGKTVESGGVPIPLVVAPCAFDGESEYHYWSASPEGRLQLVCGNADGPKAPKTRCENVARANGWPRVPYSEPPATAK